MSNNPNGHPYPRYTFGAYAPPQAPPAVQPNARYPFGAYPTYEAPAVQPAPARLVRGAAAPAVGAMSKPATQAIPQGWMEVQPGHYAPAATMYAPAAASGPWNPAPPIYARPAPAVAPVQTVAPPTPAQQRARYGVPVTAANQERINPPNIFRPAGASRSAAPSPASFTNPLPVQPQPTIVLGGRQPPGQPANPHPALMLGSAHKIEFRGRVYPNAERLYHSLKFEDLEHLQGVIEAVILSADPKKEAEQYRNYWRKDWETKKDWLMRDVLQHKLAQYPGICDELLGTGSCDIVDGEDSIANTLGKGLMILRADFRRK